MASKKLSLNVSESALEKFRTLIAENKTKHIRIYKGGGCCAGVSFEIGYGNGNLYEGEQFIDVGGVLFSLPAPDEYEGIIIGFDLIDGPFGYVVKPLTDET